ncbi:MAG: hypothetical protein HY795_10980 [Desulfovibrio sp.]|jgi:alkylhydroperoxidase family enzyme|nr:hypothetical protein [Desulfovibrio sp.]MBI4959825.1 hypothetical protein [Desulfovibrio sp.]
MFLLKTQSPEKATGKTAEVYSVFPKQIGVPIPLQLLSASPGILERQADMIRYFMGHPRLTPGLLASIRYAVAAKTGHSACEALNQGLLKQMGMTEDEIKALHMSPSTAPLEESEEKMFAFVMRAFNDPASVTQADIESLRHAGYTDGDILDAMYHASGMLAGSVLFKAFVRM